MSQRVPDFVLLRGLRLRIRLKDRPESKCDSKHRKPLRKIHLDRGIFLRDPVAFRCEVGILKYQNTADRNRHAAEWCLSEGLAFSPVKVYLCPRSRVNLNGRPEHNRGGSCPVGLDVVA